MKVYKFKGGILNVHHSTGLAAHNLMATPTLTVSQLRIRWNLPMSVYLITVFPPLPAIAPDFSQNLVKTQTLARQGGDVLIECKPRMSPRGVISWRKGKEALRESYRYVCVRLLYLRRINSLFYVCPFDILGDRTAEHGPHGFNSIQFELHNTLCAPPPSLAHPTFLSFLGNTVVLCRSWLRSATVSALFTQRNWPFADRGRFGSMCWSISSLAACKAGWVIRAWGKLRIRPPSRHGRSRWNPPKDRSIGEPANYTHSCEIAALTPGGTSWTPCFIRNRVKCRPAQCLCRQPRRRERRRKRCQSDEAGGNSFSLRIRCRGQLAMRPRAVFLTQQPAGSWSKAALTTSVSIQFVFGGEGDFTWSVYRGITVSFPVQPLPPPTLLTHPNKRHTSWWASCAEDLFQRTNKWLQTKASLQKTDAFAEEWSRFRVTSSSVWFGCWCV